MLVILYLPGIPLRNIRYNAGYIITGYLIKKEFPGTKTGKSVGGLQYAVGNGEIEKPAQEVKNNKPM